MHKISINFIFNIVFLGGFALLAVVPWASIVSAEFNLTNMLATPSIAHPLGTDNLGRDLLVRLSEAVKYSVMPIWLGVLISSLLGCFLGVFSIQWRILKSMSPMVDLSRLLATVVVSIPVGLMAFSWAALGEQTGLVPVMCSICLVFALRNYLMICDLYRHDEHKGFWQAHASIGGRLGHRLWRYGVLGEWKWPLLDALGFHLKAAVAIEASLSYLGFGIQEPTASFGNMLASHFDLYLKGHWYVLIVIVCSLALCAAIPAIALAAVSEMGAKKVN